MFEILRPSFAIAYTVFAAMALAMFWLNLPVRR
jgi:hypothetical protein